MWPLEIFPVVFAEKEKTVKGERLVITPIASAPVVPSFHCEVVELTRLPVKDILGSVGDGDSSSFGVQVQLSG